MSVETLPVFALFIAITRLTADSVVNRSGLQQLTGQRIQFYRRQQGADICSFHYLINHNITSQDDGEKQRLSTAAHDFSIQQIKSTGFTGLPPYVKVGDD